MAITASLQDVSTSLAQAAPRTKPQAEPTPLLFLVLSLEKSIMVATASTAAQPPAPSRLPTTTAHKKHTPTTFLMSWNHTTPRLPSSSLATTSTRVKSIPLPNSSLSSSAWMLPATSLRPTHGPTWTSAPSPSRTATTK